MKQCQQKGKNAHVTAVEQKHVKAIVQTTEGTDAENDAEKDEGRASISPDFDPFPFSNRTNSTVQCIGDLGEKHQIAHHQGEKNAVEDQFLAGPLNGLIRMTHDQRFS